MTVAIQAIGLTRRFREVIAVNALDLSIEKGELFALLGVNGAGKTTTIKMLTCLLRPTTGDALLLGDSIRTHPAAVKAKTNISPQETAVARNLTVEENLQLMAEIYGCAKRDARVNAEKRIVSFGLQAVAKRRAKTLSGGMQRRLSIALAMISDPHILFLDEPTLGLDVLARRELWAGIRALKGRVTIVLTTHSMDEAEALSDRIGIMSQGELKAAGTAGQLKASTGSSTLEDAFVSLATHVEVR